MDSPSSDQTDSLLQLLNQEDIWIDRIFPFLGFGQFAFVAGTNQRLKELYQEYVTGIPKEQLPLVKAPNEPRRTLVHHTFYSNVFSSLSCAKYWHKHHSPTPHNVCRMITKQGNLDILQWAVDKGYHRGCDDLEMFKPAARQGHQHILQYGLDSGLLEMIYKSLMAEMARGGHFELLKWAHEEKGASMDWRTTTAAAESGNLELLLYASRNGALLTDTCCVAAAKTNQLKILQWVHEKRRLPDRWEGTVSMAASNGHLDILVYAQEQGASITSVVCAAAAAGGHLNVIKWAHEEQGVSLDWNALAAAVTNGHLKVVEYVHQQGGVDFFGGRSLCRQAAAKGALDTLRYAREQECEWDQRTTEAAANNGHLHVLQYAYENGCPWLKEGVCTKAAGNGHLDILVYAHEHGCPWDTDTCFAAAYNGHLEVLQYAHRNGCPWDDRICEAASARGHVQILKYAADNGCPWLKTTLPSREI